MVKKEGVNNVVKKICISLRKDQEYERYITNLTARVASRNEM